MLAEAIEVIRTLWKGGNQNHAGKHYTVENARIYDVPDEPPPIYVAAGGPRAVELAGRAGDGLISLAPDAEILAKFDDAGGRDKPRLAEIQACWNPDERKALEIAREWWPNAALGGELTQELPLPRHFEQAAENVSAEDLASTVAYGPDPERHLAMIRKYLDAGYTHVWVHQIGPDQDGFFEFYATEVLPKLS